MCWLNYRQLNKKTVILLGVYIGWHDSNISLSVDGEVKYAKSERMTGIKHHKSTLSFIKEMCDTWGIQKPDAVAFSDGNRNGLGICDKGQLVQPIKAFQDWWGDIPSFCLDHHYSHILSSWPIVPMEKVNIGIAIDAQGDNKIKTLVVSNPGSLSPKIIYSTEKRSFGSLLERIGLLMNLKGYVQDIPGKVMGAQSYGTIDWDYINSINIQQIMETDVYDFITKISWRGRIPEPTPLITRDPWPQWKPVSNPDFFNFSNSSFRDWLATVHHAVEIYLVDFFKRFCHPGDTIVYSGGCSQNVVYNEKLSHVFSNLFIPPHGYDGGISLGCLEFLRLFFDEPHFSTKGFPYWQNDCESEQPNDQTMSKVVELLKQNKIVGWFQGRGEIGPRALGHRSILMNPSNREAKNTINTKIKHREHWRPYAPSILESKASEWFVDLKKPSPYMLRSVSVKKNQKSIIPAVVHQDNTSRIQTVADNLNNELDIFSQLLQKFEEQTGIPMLLNTSLNDGGYPIFSTKQQCMSFYGSVPMDALCIGNKLYVKS